MKKETSNQPKMLVNTRDLANMLSIGTINASKVGEQAGAVVRIGNRKLYNVQKVRTFLESQSVIALHEE